MKKLTLLFVGTLSLEVCIQSQPEPFLSNETNLYFTTSIRGENEVRRPYVLSRHDHVMLKKPMAEELPAGGDVAGNWGVPTNGLQLSIRFYQQEFLLGEPVVAIITLRNLNTEPHYVGWLQKYHYDFDYFIRQGTNEFMWTKPRETELPTMITGGETHGETIPAHSQAVTLVKLNQLFDLNQTGKYSIQVRHRERINEGQHEVINAVSDTATFQIKTNAALR